MNCPEFLERFSDFYDGSGDDAFRAAAEAHVRTCSTCSRYVEVVDRGTDLLQAAPRVKVSNDFRPRLQHRIYHIEDSEALASSTMGSGTTAITALVMAVLVAAAAWSPALRGTPPEVELSPIVVSRPAARSLGLGIRMTHGLMLTSSPQLPVPRHLWDGSHALLYRYSPLAGQLDGATAVRRAGLD